MASYTPGVREFEADFWAPGRVVSEIDINHRKDALVLNPRITHAVGPIALGDDSAGLQDRTWRVRADDDNIYLARENDAGNGWDAEIVLFADYPQPPSELAVVDAISLCFNDAAQPVVALDRAGEVWYIWYHPTLLFYQLTKVGPGRTPKVILDKFPLIGIGCGPPAYVQMIYIRDDELIRLTELSNFEVEEVCSLTATPNRYLETFFPTAGRRLSIVYSDRDLITGRYELKRQDTLPYPSELLKRPFFVGDFFDIVWFQGEQWYSPVGSVVTNTRQLKVQVLDHVDAIEVQASDNGLVWNIQNQDSAVLGYLSLNPGDSIQFPFEITHGSGSMSPSKFRARTRKQVGPDLCIGPWEYFFAARGAGNLSVVSVDIDGVNHRQTFNISSTDGQLYLQYRMVGGGIFDGFAGSSATVVVEQVFNGTAWVSQYRFTTLNVDRYDFTDDQGTIFGFDLRSHIFADSVGAPGLDVTALDANQSPMGFPPVAIVYGDVEGFPGWEAEGVSEEEDPLLTLPLPIVQEGTYQDGGSEILNFQPEPQHVEQVFGGVNVELEAGAAINTDATVILTLRRTEVYGVLLFDYMNLPLVELPCFFVPTDCGDPVPAVTPTDLLASAVDYECAFAPMRIVPGEECIPEGTLDPVGAPWIIGDGQLLGSGIMIG